MVKSTEVLIIDISLVKFDENLFIMQKYVLLFKIKKEKYLYNNICTKSETAYFLIINILYIKFHAIPSMRAKIFARQKL